MKINKNTKKYLKYSLISPVLLLVIFFFLSGCGVTPPKSMIPPTYVKPTAQNGGVQSKPVLGSLWDGSDSGTNLYSDNIAYKLNDIVTIIVNNQTQVNNSSGTVLSHNSSGLGSIALESIV